MTISLHQHLAMPAFTHRRLPWSRRVALLLVAAALFLLVQALMSSSSLGQRKQPPWQPPAAPPVVSAERVTQPEPAHERRDRVTPGADASRQVTDALLRAVSAAALPSSQPAGSQPPSNPCEGGASGGCAPTELQYRLVTGDQAPLACVDGVSQFDRGKVVNGYNVVVLNAKTSKVDSVRYFDTSDNERELVGFVYGLSESSTVMLVSSGSIGDRLSTELREALIQLGAAAEKLADVRGAAKSAEAADASHAADEQLQHPDRASNESTFSLIMVGQRGASGGAALLRIVIDESRPNEMSGAGAGSRWSADQAGKRGVRRHPAALRFVTWHPSVCSADITLSMRDACPKGHMAVSVYSGRNKDDQPKMCVDGRMVMARNLNNGGRGLNVAVLNATNRDVLRVAHFDTYAEDSSTLEIFLEQMVEGEMIAIVSFDEAATKLSSLAKEMLYELGSGLAQNIKFRASWYFVGQKGISGFSPFEELNYARNNEWAKPVDKRLCVPAKLDGLKAHVDAPARKENEARRQFCNKYDGYEEFCDDEHVDEPLTAAPSVGKTDSPVARVPLVVVAGLSHNSLRLTLETLLRQPSIVQQNVLGILKGPGPPQVAYDENYEECGALASLFGFWSTATNATASYMHQFGLAVEAAVLKFPEATEFIVLEEELLLTADFLHYMGQLLPVLQADTRILAVSAWNENGFVGTSSDEAAVYRVEGATALLGFMMSTARLKRLFVDEKQTARVWDGWSMGGEGVVEVIVPDLSRVVRRRTDGLAVLKPGVDALLRRPRAYVKRHGVQLASVDRLQPGNIYDRYLSSLIQSAEPLASTSPGADALNGCMKRPTVQEQKAIDVTRLGTGTTGGKEPLVVFVQSGESMSRMAACLGLYRSEDGPLRGAYKGVIRFSSAGRPCVLVGSDSGFYKLLPSSVAPFS